MALELFGYSFSKTGDKEKDLKTFAPPVKQDGAIDIEDYSVDYTSNTKYILDFDTHFDTEEHRINGYRKASSYTECDYAITNIVNEAVVQDQLEPAVTVNLDDVDGFSENIKDKIVFQWEQISNLLSLNKDIDHIFKRWYVDGKVYYHKLIDEKNPLSGIKELRFLDPRRIKKVRESIKKETENGEQVLDIKEYFVYSFKPILKKKDPHAYVTKSSQLAIEINPDMIAYAHSGLTDLEDDSILSHLNKALKPLNQLNLIEDALVIYRIARAPERRVFYIDVGNLPKTRADQYIKNIIQKYKNKFVYDVDTGTVTTKKNNLSMMEDVWLPRRDGCFQVIENIELFGGGNKTLARMIEDYNNGIENWVYSAEPKTGKIVPGLVSWAGITRKNSPIMEVHLDNEKVIKCTLDHKFILRDGTKIEAQNLSVNDSLMPFYSTDTEIYDNETGKWLTKNVVYIIYKTTNLVNGKIYIGKHKQYGMEFDGYLGSGTILKKAIKKYGRENFKRETLFFFNNNKAVLEKEQELITEEFISSKNNYNTIPGGFGGSYIRTPEHNKLMSERTTGIKNTKEHNQALSKAGKKFFETDAGEIRKQEISKNNKTDIRIREGLKKGRETITILRENDKKTLSYKEYLEKWSPGIQKAAKKLQKYNEYQKNLWRTYDFDTILMIVDRVPRKDIIEEVRKIYPEFSISRFEKIVKHNGYGSVSKFYKFRNHKVSKLVFTDETCDVGTLTIDEDHIYHDYHNFALSSGIFIMNSRGTEVTTLEGGCLSMNTQVPLLDGRTLSLEELTKEYKTGKENWVYGTNPKTGEIVPSIISWAGVTQKSAKVMKLTLDNGNEIVCTPDHKFPVLEKGFVRADELEINESMIPYNTKKKVLYADKKYEYIFQNNIKKWMPVHRMVTESFKDNIFEHKPNTKTKNTVHHIDFNRFNNSPSNLVFMGQKDHFKYHQTFRMKDYNKIAWSGDSGKKLRENHKKTQKIEIDNLILSTIINLVKNKSTHQFTIVDVVNSLNSNNKILNTFQTLNEKKNIPNYDISTGFSATILKRAVKDFGYVNWLNFRKECTNHNHKIISIEYLDTPIEVGTLTIGHDFHTFALTSGIFTKNSNLGEIEDISYFKNKLYRSLNVPVSRLDSESTFNIGRSSEITRDEVLFSKFVDGLRRQFNDLLYDILRTQLLLTNIINAEEWEEQKNNIRFVYKKDSYFEELKSQEILEARVNILQNINEFTNKYYSVEWIRKHLLMQDEEEMKEIDKQIKKEKKLYADVDAEEGGFGQDQNQFGQPQEQPPQQFGQNNADVAQQDKGAEADQDKAEKEQQRQANLQQQRDATKA